MPRGYITSSGRRLSAVYTQYDESTPLGTLVFILHEIAGSEEIIRGSIINAYDETKAVVASMPLAGTDARPCIIAFLKQFDIIKAAGDFP